jgi:23S rRNA pseudouridine1911/1915/1917 synthase
MDDRVIMVSADDAGRRLLEFLSERLINESKARLRQLVGTGRIRVCNKAVLGTELLRGGDVVSLPSDVDAGPPAPSEFVIEVLYEDEDHVAINKPAGHPVLPTRSGDDRKFRDAIVALANRGRPAGKSYVRPHIVHRLDRDTTGVLLVAKNERAGRALCLQFQHRKVHKVYLGIIEGVLPKDDFVVEIPLRRQTPRGMQMVTAEKGGKAAATHIILKEKFGHFSLLELRPLTGRQHQLRVHLAAIGYPLAVDRLYGRRERLTAAEFSKIVGAVRSRPDDVLLGRVPLHALSLAYHLPSSGELIEITAPIPEDIEAFLDVLRRADPS